MAWQAHTPCPNELKQEAKLAREELEAKCTLLKESAEGLEYQGPTLDCVAWHDGQHYRVAIDTSDMYPEDPSKGRHVQMCPAHSQRAVPVQKLAPGQACISDRPADGSVCHGGQRL